MPKKTTPDERSKYIQEQREASASHGHGPTRRVLGDMSFIDKARNIVRPTRDNPYPTPRRYDESTAPAERSAYQKQRDSLLNDGLRATRELKERMNKKGYGPKRYHGTALIAVSIAGILAGIFFLSSNITGNAVANMTNSTSSFVGAGLLIIGLIAGAFALKSK